MSIIFLQYNKLLFTITSEKKKIVTDNNLLSKICC